MIGKGWKSRSDRVFSFSGRVWYALGEAGLACVSASLAGAVTRRGWLLWVWRAGAVPGAGGGVCRKARGVRPHDDRGGVADVHGARRAALGDGDDKAASGEHVLAEARGLGPKDQAGALGQDGPFKGDGAVYIVDTDEGQALTLTCAR